MKAPTHCRLFRRPPHPGPLPPPKDCGGRGDCVAESLARDKQTGPGPMSPAESSRPPLNSEPLNTEHPHPRPPRRTAFLVGAASAWLVASALLGPATLRPVTPVPTVIPPTASPHADCPLVGAIRWDAWHGDLGEPGRVVQQTLAPAKYHFRLPWFAQVHDEGGWLCPTRASDGKPDTRRIEAVGRLLRRWTSHETADQGERP
jgi:hypothetical protein